MPTLPGCGKVSSDCFPNPQQVVIRPRFRNGFVNPWREKPDLGDPSKSQKKRGGSILMVPGCENQSSTILYGFSSETPEKEQDKQAQNPTTRSIVLKPISLNMEGEFHKTCSHRISLVSWRGIRCVTPNSIGPHAGTSISW